MHATLRFTLTAALAAVVAGCSEPPAPRTAESRAPVEFAPVQYSATALPIRAAAVVARRSEAELSFKVRGLIASVDVRAGDAVVAGQELARLQLDEIEAQVTQAQGALAKARRELERVEKLEAARVATLESLQDARTAVDVLAAQLQVAEFNRRHAVITAPAGGYILQRRAEPGELVESGRPVLVFAADADGWMARAALSDRDVVRVQVGNVASITFPDAADRSLGGRVAHISAGADPATRTTPIEISLDQAPPAARSGQVVIAIIQPADVRARPVVPASALIEGTAETASVFVVENGMVRRRPVRVEAVSGVSAYLTTPLPEEAQIAVRGAEYLRDGEPLSAKAGTVASRAP